MGLGCMRLSTDENRDGAVALATIAAVAGAGMTVFDTAHSYGLGADELGHNEALLARALRACGASEHARVVTKGGMTHAAGAWVPDGRAKAIRADCEASLAALGGLPIDLYLIHAAIPRTPWGTSVRALARLVEEGLVGHIGVANVSRPQLGEALELAPIEAVQVALSPFDDRALRGGVSRCVARGPVIAHSPLGGPRRAGGLAGTALVEIAEARRCTPAGSRSRGCSISRQTSSRFPERDARDRPIRRASSESRARRRRASALARARRRSSGSRPAPRATARSWSSWASREPEEPVAEEYVDRGYPRLNRDERGGSLRELAGALDARSPPACARVLDNTYLTRAARSHVIETAGRHGLPVRCVWLDTPLAQAQVNLVERLLVASARCRRPAKLRMLARGEPGVLAPTSQMRSVRGLEPPSIDEGSPASSG